MPDREVLKWQRRMSSFMTAAIIVSAAFFAFVTLWQFRGFELTLDPPPTRAEEVWAGPKLEPTTYQEAFELARARAALALERDLIARRYDQANLTLTTRLWTRLMGFITGMILALVGAAFVLGKLSEEVSEAAAKAGVPGNEWSFSFRSASPGIILAILGTILMALSISIQATFTAEDSAVYFGRVGGDGLILSPIEATSPAQSLTNSSKSPGLIGGVLKGPSAAPKEEDKK